MARLDTSKQTTFDQSANEKLSHGSEARSWRDRISNLPTGERYLYQLFSLIEASFRYGSLHYQLLFYKGKQWQLNDPLTFSL